MLYHALYVGQYKHLNRVAENFIAFANTKCAIHSEKRSGMINTICRFVFFKLLGWRMDGLPPAELKKYLFVAVPHTSNWDFVIGWMASRALNINLTIFVKDTFFVWPLIYFCKFFGCAPVNRRERTNFVDTICQRFAESDQLIAVITPEGTRKKVPELKSGYYHLAKKANVPIVLVGPNYLKKSLVLIPPRPAMATFDEDQAHIREYCKLVHGKHPQNSFG